MNNTVPRIVEVVGPAGAGKTTLCRILSQQSEAIYPGNFPDVRKLSNVPFFLWNGIKISPALLNLPCRTGRKLVRREFAWLSILNGWPEILQRDVKNNQTIILDQGPVYLLSETFEFGPEYLRDQTAGRFWRELYDRWANTLNLIVFLDAPDADLLKRIRNRHKDHVVKNESVENTIEFLARYRKAYERTIFKLATYQKTLKVLRFDSGTKSLEQIANQLVKNFLSA